MLLGCTVTWLSGLGSTLTDAVGTLFSVTQ